MSARDDAIRAIRERADREAHLPWPLGWVVDAIPGDVHARLAIERGALHEVKIGTDGCGHDHVFGRNAGGFTDADYFDPENETLYRLVTP